MDLWLTISSTSLMRLLLFSQKAQSGGHRCPVSWGTGGTKRDSYLWAGRELSTGSRAPTSGWVVSQCKTSLRFQWPWPWAVKAVWVSVSSFKGEDGCGLTWNLSRVYAKRETSRQYVKVYLSREILQSTKTGVKICSYIQIRNWIIMHRGMHFIPEGRKKECSTY